MAEPPNPVSRRRFISATGTLLAGFRLAAAPPLRQSSSPVVHSATQDLALYRPVKVSSTDYAATPAEFAVDGLSTVGVRGTGWRAAQGDPQWITVDLQAPCRIQ